MRWSSWLLLLAATGCRQGGGTDWVNLAHSSDSAATATSIAGVVPARATT